MESIIEKNFLGRDIGEYIMKKVKDKHIIIYFENILKEIIE